jgi:N-(2-amino-2-carboxyethyl)-L-glutamate synthase
MRVGIFSTVGNTPLVRMDRVFENAHFQLFAKLESFNPGGSVKDRAAFNILKQAFEQGEIRPGTTVIESSSGNMGIGLALACAHFGLRLICVVDPKTTKQNISILKAYRAEVDIVEEPDTITGDYLQARLNRVQSLLRSTKDSYWPNQYSNLYNASAHYETMREIVTELERIDYLFCATSTCGTLRGCSEYARDNQLKTSIIAVDAIGSVIFGGYPSKRLIPGHGAARCPELYQPGLANRSVLVSDLDCIVGCRRLVRSESILAGGSSGAVLMAIDQVKNDISEGATCVAIFPDRGERYLDTIYSDLWVEDHFGNVSHLWEGSEASSATPALNEVREAPSSGFPPTMWTQMSGRHNTDDWSYNGQ